jgi:hypothetical protein
MVITMNLKAKQLGPCVYHSQSAVPAMELWFDDTVLITLEGQPIDMLRAFKEMVDELISETEDDDPDVAREARIWAEAWGKL